MSIQHVFRLRAWLLRLGLAELLLALVILGGASRAFAQSSVQGVVNDRIEWQTNELSRRLDRIEAQNLDTRIQILEVIGKGTWALVLILAGNLGLQLYQI